MRSIALVSLLVALIGLTSGCDALFAQAKTTRSMFARSWSEFTWRDERGTLLSGRAFYVEVLVFVALIYFALCWPLSKTSQILERKLHVAHIDR